MFRYLGLTVLGLAAAAILNAGQIQIGASSGTNGLTGGTGSTGYVIGTAPCAGSYGSYDNSASFSGCITGAAGGANATGGTPFAAKSFTTGLFNGTTPAITVPTSLTNVVDANGNDVNFDIANNVQWAGAGGTNAGNTPGGAGGAWNGVAADAGTVSLTVPIGVFDVNTAWTLLEDYWGASGEQNTTVIFNFGNSSNVTNGDSLTFTLTNGNQIGAAYTCMPMPCLANPPATIGSSSGTTVAWSANYTADSATTWSGTAGTVNLDDQVYNLTGGNRANEWLVDMVIENTGGVGSGSTFTSRTSLDAITIDAVPEPSTILLFATGLGALGFTRLRCRKRA